MRPYCGYLANDASDSRAAISWASVSRSRPHPRRRSPPWPSPMCTTTEGLFAMLRACRLRASSVIEPAVEPGPVAWDDVRPSVGPGARDPVHARARACAPPPPTPGAGSGSRPARELGLVDHRLGHVSLLPGRGRRRGRGIVAGDPVPASRMRSRRRSRLLGCGDPPPPAGLRAGRAGRRTARAPPRARGAPPAPRHAIASASSWSASSSRSAARSDRARTTRAPATRISTSLVRSSSMTDRATASAFSTSPSRSARRARAALEATRRNVRSGSGSIIGSTSSSGARASSRLPSERSARACETRAIESAGGTSFARDRERLLREREPPFAVPEVGHHTGEVRPRCDRRGGEPPLLPPARGSVGSRRSRHPAHLARARRGRR